MSGMTELHPSGAPRILVESLAVAQEHLNHILLSLQNFPELQELRNHDTHQRITTLTLEIGTFVELTTLLTRLLTKHTGAGFTAARESHVHLLFVMKGINQSQQKGDVVALEDLIKYELKDNLTQWKIDLIPQAKRLLQI